MQPIRLLAFQHAKPDRVDALRDVIRALAKASRDEAGCIEYKVYIDKERPNVIVFQETWATQDDLDRHFNSAMFQSFWTLRMDYLESDVALHFLAEFA